MAARRILFLDAGGLSAWRWHRGRVEGEGIFPADDADALARFAAYVGERRGSLYFMLADVAEEGFQLEDIPPLRGRNRIALIKRKLDRYYPSTPLTVALPLGRRQQGRGDERMLFAALTRPEQFEPWLKVLKAERASLAGVFSLAQVVTALFSRQARQGLFLLVTMTRGGLRQTFVESGRVRFSRLAPLGAATPAEAAALCAREAAKIRHYLEGQGLVATEAPLAVRVVVHPSQEAVFRAHCPDGNQLRYEYLDLPAHAARCGLKSALPDSNAEMLFGHLLVRHTPRAQFAHADARHVFRLGQIRFALRFAGCAALVACLAFAASRMLALQQLEASTMAVRAHNEDDERRYQALLAARPRLPLAPERLLPLAERYEELLQRSPGPAPMYRRLSAALDESREIRLERLTWSVADHAEGPGDAQAPRPTPGEDAYAVADVEASLPLESAKDLSGQSAVIERFVAHLRRDRAVEVRLLSLPFDAESAKALTGGTDLAPAMAPRFMLRVVERLGRQ
jgi:hypothetical protein